jgi:hypothetical protein
MRSPEPNLKAGFSNLTEESKKNIKKLAGIDRILIKS